MENLGDFYKDFKFS